MALQVVELCGNDANDADAVNAATVLAAYFDAEEAFAICRRTWRWAAILALAVWAVKSATAIVTTRDFVASLFVLALVAAGASIIQWRARRRLKILIRST